MDGPVSFGEWLRQRREALHLSRPELAQRASCSVPALRKIELGERRPSRHLAELLATALGLSPDDGATFIRVARGELNLERLPLADEGTAAARATTRLPIPLTPLLGRETELAELARLLSDPYCRLLTVTGAGGIGKTRLALEAACAHSATQATYLVALAPLTSAEFIVPAIADALSFKFSGPADPATQLLRYLRDRPMLLVLDNFEHLLADAEAEPAGPTVGGALVAAVLQGAPGVKFLVTSRERLELHGEWVFDLHGLPTPAADVVQAQDLSASSAIQLFIQSARRAQTGFEPRPADWPAVARICRMVAGVPLAIELAAAWVRVLSCSEIASEIDRTLAADPALEFLTTSLRDVPERHRSMRAVIDHSWKLLSQNEQRALRELAVFRGGFTREAAERVAGAPLAQLSALAAKSLVQRVGQARYDLHELVRQYAAARLAAAADEQQSAHERHSLYYLGLLEEGGDLSSRRKETLAELIVEMGNLRPAWEWAATHVDSARLCQVSITLWYLFELRNWSLEGEIVFRQAAETLQTRAHAERSEPGEAGIETALHLMRAHAAYFGFRLGRVEAAYAALVASATHMWAGADPYASIFISWCLGFVCYALGRFAEANDNFHECLARSRAHGKLFHEAWALEGLGIVAHEEGRHEQARSDLAEALRVGRQTGDKLLTSHVLYFCGRTANALGEYTQAETLLHEGLVLARAVGYPSGAALALYGLGQVAQAMGNPDEADALFAESSGLFQEIGEVRAQARVLTHQGLNGLARGDAAGAKASFRAALRLADECGAAPVALEALAGLAALHNAAKDQAPDLTLELIGLVLEHPASTQAAKGLATRVNAQLQPYLAPEQIQAARQRARSKDLTEVVRQVLASP